MKARKWDFRNLPFGEPMISNVVCENLLIIIYFQFIWRWSRDSVLGGRSSLPQTRKVKNIMFETSGNIFAYRLQSVSHFRKWTLYVWSSLQPCQCWFSLLFSIDTIEKRFMALIDCICVKKMTRINPSALTVWPEKLRGWEKKNIQVILGLTKTVKFVEIYCPLVNMCSVLLFHYSLIFFLRLNTSPRTVVVQGHSQLTSLIHLNPRPKLNEATVPGAWIYYQ